MRREQLPRRLREIVGIGVDEVGAKADEIGQHMLRLDNLDTDILPDEEALAATRLAVGDDRANSYLPFTGHLRLRKVVAAHVSRLSGLNYDAERNCLITAGGLLGILNVLLAIIDDGDEVIVTSPIYAGLLNRIRLAGGVVRFAHLVFRPGNTWSLDHASLRAAISSKTRAMLMMSPSMPTGAYLDKSDWRMIAEFCVERDLTLIVDAAMERLLFDGRAYIHPSSIPGMADRTVVVGSASKEMRLISWRVGWIIAPEHYLPAVTAVCIANAIVPVGIAQEAAAIALERSQEFLPRHIAELQRRRDVLLEECKGLPYGVPAGGWSMLLRVSDYDLDGTTMSARLLAQGVAATPMIGWGDRETSEYIRFVYSNEPEARLRGAGEKIRAALGRER